MSTENTVNKRKANRRTDLALLRCVCSLVLALALLWITDFSVFTMLKGPTESPDIQAEEQGAFVFRDINFILGFYSGDYSKGENSLENIGVVPMGGKMVSVLFTNRYMESAQAVCENTYGYINGSTEPNKYITVQGTVDMLMDDESRNFYDWFDYNKDQMVEIGLILDTDEAADYISDYILVVDTVNGMGQNTVIGLTVVSVLLLVYMLVEMILMACGVYRYKAPKAEAEGAEDEKPEESPAEEQPEEKREDSGETRSGDESVTAEESEGPGTAEEEGTEASGSERDAESEAAENEEEAKLEDEDKEPEDKERSKDEA